MDQPELTGTLFDIQGFSVHDGPGCRTLIFLKGCPLSCEWCSNPEGRNPFPEPLYNQTKCVFDNLCIDACPHDAITPGHETLSINRSLCAECHSFECADVCCSGAIQQGGYTKSLNELITLIQRDRQYWGSQGGITLTGGEPLYQPEFASALLKHSHDAYIHTAIETCGHVSWSSYVSALPYTDWIFFDIKHMDPEQHVKGTGLTNKLILENAQRLAAEFSGKLVFRMTLIPGYNDQMEHIQQLADFIVKSGRKEINILPLHHLGREKYMLTGRPYYTSDFTPPSPESMNHIKDFMEANGISCYLGSDTPF